MIAFLTGQAHGGFDGAIAAADHQNLLVDVMVGLDEAVHHLGQIFAFDTELARFAGASEGENDGAGAILIGGRNDREDSVGPFLDVIDFFARTDVEVGAIQDHVPESEQILLGELHLFELAVHGKLDRTGHDEFLTGIFGDGAADFIPFNGDVFQLVLDGPQRGADSGRSGTDDQNIVDAGHRRNRIGFEAGGDGIDAVAALIDRVLD